MHYSDDILSLCHLLFKLLWRRSKVLQNDRNASVGKILKCFINHIQVLVIFGYLVVALED